MPEVTIVEEKPLPEYPRSINGFTESNGTYYFNGIPAGEVGLHPIGEDYVSYIPVIGTALDVMEAIDDPTSENVIKAGVSGLLDAAGPIIGGLIRGAEPITKTIPGGYKFVKTGIRRKAWKYVPPKTITYNTPKDIAQRLAYYNLFTAPFDYMSNNLPNNFLNKDEKIKHQHGGQIIRDNRGQWAHPGKNTMITGDASGTNIVNYDDPYNLLAVSNLGELQYIPANDPGPFHFEGSSVVEYPIKHQYGGLVKQFSYSKVPVVRYNNGGNILQTGDYITNVPYIDDGTKPYIKGSVSSMNP